MKVIKHAINALSWKHNLTCWFCKIELEAVINDVKYSGERGNWADNTDMLLFILTYDFRPADVSFNKKKNRLQLRWDY